DQPVLGDRILLGHAFRMLDDIDAMADQYFRRGLDKRHRAEIADRSSFKRTRLYSDDRKIEPFVGQIKAVCVNFEGDSQLEAAMSCKPFSRSGVRSFHRLTAARRTAHCASFSLSNCPILIFQSRASAAG